MGLRLTLELGPELARPGMEPAPIGRRDTAIDRIAQELMTEVVQTAVSGRPEHAVVDQLLERRIDRFGRDVHDPGQDLRHEAPPDDGARPGNLPSLGRPMREPSDHRVLDRLGDRGLPDRVSVRSCIRAERAEQFLDVQRDPVSSLEYRRHDFARCGQAGVEDQRRHQGGFRFVERAQPQLLGETLGDRARERQSRKLVPIGASSVR